MGDPILFPSAGAVMEEIISLTRDLIQFKTTPSNPEQIRGCADFIEDYFSRCRVNWKRTDHDGVPSILVLPREHYAPVLLMAHMDVLNGSDDLFEPFVEDNKLYGRGSIDDKYAVALCMVLLKNFLNDLRSSHQQQEDLPFGILITGDEETGGYKGAKRALEKIRTDFCIALDGGGLQKIVVKEKGILRLKLVSKGKAAHGARPWLGENAIENLIQDYGRMRTSFEQSAPEHWHRTMNFSLIKGGEVVNQVPDYAEGIFDIRYTENDNIEELIDALKTAVRGELSVLQLEPLFYGGESPYLDMLLEISKTAEIGFEHGASDARFLADHGIKGIVWGADGDQSQHSSDEHVKIESVFELYRILFNFMKRCGEIQS